MPFPHTASERLIRHEPLTLEDWYSLLETRRSNVNPYLNTITLRRLGDTDFFQGFSNAHELELNDHIVNVSSHYGLSLASQGIFGGIATRAMEGSQFGNGPDTLRTFWGLTRDGRWMLGNVCSARLPVKHGSGRQLDEIYQVNLTDARLDAFPFVAGTFTPRQVWDTLGRLIYEWRKRYQETLEQADRISEQFLHEDELVKLIGVLHPSPR